MKKIVLKKVKVYELLSEETICFNAELYEDGKFMAVVSNNGKGGSNNIYPANGLSYKDIEHLTDLDTECLIMEMATLFDFVSKNQRNHFVLKKGDKLFRQKLEKPISFLKKLGNYDFWVQQQIKSLQENGFEVLNRNL